MPGDIYGKLSEWATHPDSQNVKMFYFQVSESVTGASRIPFSDDRITSLSPSFCSVVMVAADDRRLKWVRGR